jgi:hypothetical protein
MEASNRSGIILSYVSLAVNLFSFLFRAAMELSTIDYYPAQFR